MILYLILVNFKELFIIGEHKAYREDGKLLADDRKHLFLISEQNLKNRDLETVQFIKGKKCME